MRGVAGLRLADAAIMPRLVSAKAIATSIMNGGKASDYVSNASNGTPRLIDARGPSDSL